MIRGGAPLTGRGGAPLGFGAACGPIETLGFGAACGPIEIKSSSA
jgi:hypothetical protein